jgi:signal transduction histidine kinase
VRRIMSWALYCTHKILLWAGGKKINNEQDITCFFRNLQGGKIWGNMILGMIQKKTNQTRELQFLSSGSKVGVQLMWLATLIVLPRLFPGLIEIKYKTSIAINISLAITSSIIYESLKFFYQKRGKDFGRILRAQLLTSVFLLTWFLHVFGRINGPFFILYLLTIMESALNLTTRFVSLVVGIMVAATLSEFGFLVYQQEIFLNLYTGLQLLIRLVGLFFMGSYANSLSRRIISEEEAHIKARKSTAKLERITRKLRKTNVKLKELAALKDEFVSVASHELRAPMTTIKGYVSMILEGDAGRIPPKVKEFLKDAYDSNDRMIRLVNNMLNVSRIESGRLVMTLKDIQIEEAIEDVVRGFKLEAESHGLELKYFKPEKKLPRIRVDPDRIREVISNIVGNAVNFTSRGHIHVKSYREDGMLTVSIEDTGVGISPADQKQLFKKFSQVEVGTPLRKGSGLGLYICKMLINEFGGEIWLKSKLGKGTIFYFSLPVIIDHRQIKKTKSES